MSDLIVIAFDNEADAEAAYTTVQGLQDDLIVQLTGLALVKVDPDGKTKVEYPGSATRIGAGATGGALFGTLIGILFFVPLAGLIFGGVFGALFAGLDKTSLDAQFRDRVKTAVSQGHSAIVIYASKITEDKFAAALAPFNGTVVQTSLSEDEERELIQDLGSPTTTPTTSAS
ncbi:MULTISPECIES: DUF1269 domain-containing protein [unclassified Microbacterium]|uniref:DUF1269 domain-containing protein n=1 Tax=unclassified Microbacterium TaxID=2609290 RepID=UPI003745172B